MKRVSYSLESRLDLTTKHTREIDATVHEDRLPPARTDADRSAETASTTESPRLDVPRT